jgi:hypothetical protein
LREKLLTELGTIRSADLATIWAQDALTAKNSLAAPDAKLVEEPLSGGYPSSHRLKVRKPQTTVLQAFMLISLAPMQRL